MPRRAVEVERDGEESRPDLGMKDDNVVEEIGQSGKDPL
jgi:hypothetical protein